MTSPTERPGLSRTEVVVALVIAVLIGGLVVAAVGNIRQAADRTMCLNNLKQLAMGVHLYHDSRRKLPPLVDVGEGSPTGRGLPSVFAMLDPYLEAGPVLYRPGVSPPEAYHAHSSVPFPWRDKDGKMHTAYGGVANQVWRLFLCPADATARDLRDVTATLPDGSTGHYATGSYAANALLPWRTNDVDLGSAGLILCGERPQLCRTAMGEAVHNLWGVGFPGPHLPAFTALAPDDQASPPFQRIIPGLPCDPQRPGSSHRAGLQAAMTDGSVRVFAPDTTAWVFWSACAPAARTGD